MKNKISNNIFNLKLYLEGLKQLRLVGFISLAIFVIIGVLVPVGKVIEYKEYMEWHSTPSYHNLISANSSFYFLTFMYVIVTPLIALMVFHFLTKRNASDYYHSFPQKRKCIFLSYFTAAVTWIIGIILAAIVSSLIVYLIFSKYFTIPYASIFLYGFSVFVCCLLVLSSIAMACSVTGTVFTNVIVSGIIIFLPRILILYCTQLITGRFHLLVSDSLMPLLDSKYNLVFKNVLNVFDDMGLYEDAMFSWSSILYTLIVALIYTAIALFLFIRRKSETAGNAASGKILQAVIRICVGLAVSLIPLSAIIEYYYSPKSIDSYSWFYVVVLYIIAIFGMFFYELLSTKKAKNLKKIIPSTAILAVTNGLLALFIIGVTAAEVNYCPKASDIEYVTLKISDEYDDYYYSNEVNYFSYMTNNIKLDNKELLDIVSSSLSDFIKVEKENLKKGNDDYWYDFSSRYKYATVTIKSGLFTKTRRVRFTQKDYDKCLEILYDNDDFRDVFAKLPEYNKNTMSLSTSGATDSLGNSSIVKIYNSLSEEVAAMKNPIQWYNDYPAGCLSLYMTYLYKNGITSAELPISPQNTPVTFKLYANECNKDFNDNYAKIMRDSGFNGMRWADITIQALSEKYDKDANNIYYYDYYGSFEGTEYEKEVLDAVTKMSVPDTIDPDVLEKDDTLLCRVSVSCMEFRFTVYTYIDKEYAYMHYDDEIIDEIVE